MVHDVLEGVFEAYQLMRSAKLAKGIVFLQLEILHSLINLFVLLLTFLIFQALFEELFERSKEIESVLFQLDAGEHLGFFICFGGPG